MTTLDHQPNIHDFDDWLPEATGVNVSSLGCVMLPVQFREGYLERGYAIGMLDPSDLYTSTAPEKFEVSGDVTERSHVTLLYGLMTPAYEQADTINRLLKGWQKPSWLPIERFDVFPSRTPDESYGCIVARIADDKRLVEARGLLQYLPHVDTFPEYIPHATVAYVQLEAIDRWLAWMSRGPMAVTVPATVNGQRFDLGSEK